MASVDGRAGKGADLRFRAAGVLDVTYTEAGQTVRRLIVRREGETADLWCHPLMVDPQTLSVSVMEQNYAIYPGQGDEGLITLPRPAP